MRLLMSDYSDNLAPWLPGVRKLELRDHPSQRYCYVALVLVFQEFVGYPSL